MKINLDHVPERERDEISLAAFLAWDRLYCGLSAEQHQRYDDHQDAEIKWLCGEAESAPAPITDEAILAVDELANLSAHLSD